jgi:hypothetical protein
MTPAPPAGRRLTGAAAIGAEATVCTGAVVRHAHLPGVPRALLPRGARRRGPRGRTALGGTASRGRDVGGARGGAGRSGALAAAPATWQHATYGEG